MLARVCFLAAIAALWAFPVNAVDFSFGLPTPEGLAAGMVATKGGPIGFALGTSGGAVERTATTGQPLGSALLSESGENLSAMAAARAATSFVGGGGVQGFVAKQGLGLFAGMAGREGFNAAFPYEGNSLDVPVGGLQAKLADLQSVNGMKDGIQQYDLLDRNFDPSWSEDRKKQEPKRKARQPGYNPDRQLIGRVDDYNRTGGDPDRQLIGRVPSGTDGNRIGAFSQGFLEGLAGGGNARRAGRNGGCGIQVDTPNPQSCY